MSADTHATTPTSSAPRGRLASAVAEPTVVVPVVATSGEGMLTWDQDSTVLPVMSRPQPRIRQMVAVCAWAAVLGVLGLAVGIRGFVADLLDDTPGWYEPTMIGTGLAGILLTVGAFVQVHRRRMPYVLLGAATLVLTYAIVVTALAL